MAQLSLSDVLASVSKLSDKDALLAILRMPSQTSLAALPSTATIERRIASRALRLKSTVTPSFRYGTSQTDGFGGAGP